MKKLLLLILVIVLFFVIINKKGNNKNIVNNEIETKYSNHISVLYFKNIYNDEFINLSDKISLINFEEKLKYLKDNNYYSISLDEYNDWLTDKKTLKEKAVIIITDNDVYSSYLSKYGLFSIELNTLNDYILLNNNKTNKKEEGFSNYVINDTVSIEIFKKMLNGEDVENNTQLITFDNYEGDKANSVAVLNYHFFYDKNVSSCNESICLEVSKFEEQLKYLKNNNYVTLTIDQYQKWMYGEIEVPEKSVLLTIDDGAQGTGLHNGNVLIPLLEKYKVNATLFLISGWWGVENYQSDYLDIQSHTSDMHRDGYCNTEKRGAQLLCSTYEEIIEDLKNSLNDVDSNTSFCFPFYLYNEKSLKAIKEMGFKIAFVGGERKSTRYNDFYKIPRYVISSDITLSEFISYIS